MQIRSNAESLAFLTGGPARLEEAKANQKLDSLLSTQHSLYSRQLWLNFAVNSFDYLGSIVSYLALAVPIFTGRYEGVSSAELSSLISQVRKFYSPFYILSVGMHEIFTPFVIGFSFRTPLFASTSSTPSAHWWIYPPASRNPSFIPNGHLRKCFICMVLVPTLSFFPLTFGALRKQRRKTVFFSSA